MDRLQTHSGDLLLKAAIYVRVSTADQHVESQLYDLRELAAKRSFEVVQEFQDCGVSGRRARRPGLEDGAKSRIWSTFGVQKIAVQYTVPRWSRRTSSLERRAPQPIKLLVSPDGTRRSRFAKFHLRSFGLTLCRAIFDVGRGCRSCAVGTTEEVITDFNPMRDHPALASSQMRAMAWIAHSKLSKVCRAPAAISSKLLS
jgi:hypothetical protein